MDARLDDAIAGAEAYEALHVPALFSEWTSRVLDAADVGPSHRVLDVACGTGVLAREALARVGPSGRVVGVDPNPGMLAVAERLEGRIEWRSGTAESLPQEDASFDRVVSQFGMMFFADRAQALREMMRVLTPEGRFAVAVWDALEKHPAYAAEVALLEEMAGRDAANALRAPFVLGDVAEVGRMAEQATGGPVECATVVGLARFPSVRTMVEADLRGWLPVMGVELEERTIEAILAAADGALSPYVLPDGRVEFASPAHILCGTKAA